MEEVKVNEEIKENEITEEEIKKQPKKRGRPKKGETKEKTKEKTKEVNEDISKEPKFRPTKHGRLTTFERLFKTMPVMYGLEDKFEVEDLRNIQEFFRAKEYEDYLEYSNENFGDEVKDIVASGIEIPRKIVFTKVNGIILFGLSDNRGPFIWWNDIIRSSAVLRKMEKFGVTEDEVKEIKIRWNVWNEEKAGLYIIDERIWGWFKDRLNKKLEKNVKKGTIEELENCDVIFQQTGTFGGKQWPSQGVYCIKFTDYIHKGKKVDSIRERIDQSDGNVIIMPKLGSQAIMNSGDISFTNALDLNNSFGYMMYVLARNYLREKGELLPEFRKIEFKRVGVKNVGVPVKMKWDEFLGLVRWIDGKIDEIYDKEWEEENKKLLMKKMGSNWGLEEDVDGVEFWE